MEWFNNLKPHDRFAVKALLIFFGIALVMALGMIFLGPAASLVIFLVATLASVVFFLARQWHKDWMQ